MSAFRKPPSLHRHRRQQVLRRAVLRQAMLAGRAAPVALLPKALGQATADSGPEMHTAPVARDPDEILFPAPFRDPADFAPIPPPRARASDLLELAWHTCFVLAVTVLIPLAVLWLGYQFYIRLPFEASALAVVSLAALWAYRDRLGPLLERILLGRKP